MNKIYKFLTYFISPADRRVKFYVSIMVFLKNNKRYKIAELVSRRLHNKFGVCISANAKFDNSMTIHHPIGVVIGNGCVIGRNVTIFQNVTIGRADKSINSYPKIGDNSTLYAGSVVIGGVSVGENCIIGANAVVTKDVPDNSIAVGIPAKIIKRKGVA